MTHTDWDGWADVLHFDSGAEAAVYNYMLLGLGVFQFPLTAWLAVRR